MRTIYFIIILLFAGIVSAQVGDVGINTNTPAATLDVKGHPTNMNKFDGIIAPRMTGAQLRSKTYGTDQNGALVYATVADTAPAGQTVNVTARGYYYFDANINRWVALIGSGAYHKLRVTSGSITIQPDDYTIGYTGTGNIAVTLPDASSNPQRIIRLCALNSSGGGIRIYNVSSTQFSGGQTVITPQGNGGQSCFQFQSDGSSWWAIGSLR